MVEGKIFNKHRDEIKNYCTENNLSFVRLCKSPCCYDNEELIIQRNEPDPERAKLGLADNIPTPSTLEIYLEDGNLRFEQTDITRKYLGAEDWCAVAEDAGVCYSPVPG
ncbi:MAG: hypothetical protein LBB74_09275 [Chitinispirillales bacterium]|jgi:hypothetical protein|nr:hypothetical protein [Chitinispirillales bacterium]